MTTDVEPPPIEIITGPGDPLTAALKVISERNLPSPEALVMLRAVRARVKENLAMTDALIEQYEGHR